MSFSIAEEEVATIGADILKGHMVSWNYYQTTDTEKNKEFVANYKKKYGEDRVTSDPAEAGYDEGKCPLTLFQVNFPDSYSRINLHFRVLKYVLLKFTIIFE